MKYLASILLILAILSTLALALPKQTSLGQNKQVGTHYIGEFKADALGRLRISAWNPRSLSAQSIEIEKRNDVWVLPQYANYPANAGAVVGDLAGALVAMELGQPLQVQRSAWNDYQLHDPLNETYVDGNQYGRRVSMWLDNGVSAVDIIIGAAVPGEEGKHYLRLLQDDQVFIGNIDQDLPTRFSDWVETRLLPIDGKTIRYLKSNQYRFDENSGSLKAGLYAEFIRSDVDHLWQSPNASTGKVVDDTAVYRVLGAALEARLHGVKALDLHNIKAAEAYGIFLNRGIGSAAGRNPLAGNEGVLTIGCNDGIFYNLYLGEVAAEDDTEQTALSSGFRYVMLACEYRLQEDQTYNGKNAQACMLAGTEHAKALNARFTQFVYVVEESDYKLLHPQIEALYKDPDPVPGLTSGTPGSASGAVVQP